MTITTQSIATEVANQIIMEKHLYDYTWMADTTPYVLVRIGDRDRREVYLRDIVHEEVSKLKPHKLCDIIWSWDDETPYEFFSEFDNRDNSSDLVDSKRVLIRLAGWCVYEAVVDLLDPFHWAH